MKITWVQCMGAVQACRLQIKHLVQKQAQQASQEAKESGCDHTRQTLKSMSGGAVAHPGGGVGASGFGGGRGGRAEKEAGLVERARHDRHDV